VSGVLEGRAMADEALIRALVARACATIAAHKTN
jgi:hypothetical protein